MILLSVNYPNVNVKPIFKEKMQIAFSPEFNNVPKSPVDPKDLNFEQEILINWETNFVQWHNRWCNPNVSPSVSVGNVTMDLFFLREGAYWSIIPYSIAKELQRFIPIEFCSLLNPPPDRICYELVHRFPKKPVCRV